MSEEKMFEIMNGIDDDYIMEANILQKEKRSGSQWWIKWSVVAACICLAIISGLICFGGKSDNYQVIAAEIGKEELNSGATIPKFLYADETNVIMYDYIGIWVYDYKKESLVGFCDFRPINMTQVQGDPCVFVQASKDGSKVRFYMNDGSIKYVYDVKSDSYEKVESYNEEEYLEFYDYVEYSAADSEGMSIYSDTYKMISQAEQSHVAYTFDKKDEENVYEIHGMHYKDLILLVEQNGVTREYQMFK